MPGISSPPIARARALLVASVVFFALPSTGLAQTGAQLPLRDGRSSRHSSSARRRRACHRAGERATRVARARKPPPVQPTPGERGQSGAALAVLGVQQALKKINQTPGAVALVPDTAYKNSPAQTIKDILDYVPASCAAEVGRGHPALDPRLRPVAQFPSARHPALHGRHSDQHVGRLWRLPGDRSDRLSLRRGLQGRQRAALRRQFARRRHQFRDADRPRRPPVRRPRRPRQLRFRAAQALRRCLRAVRLFRHRLGAARRTVTATTARRSRRAAAPISATRSRRMSRRASTSMPTQCASASRAGRPR